MEDSVEDNPQGGGVGVVPARERLDLSRLQLPISGQARPGDHILLYQDRQQLLGRLKGHSGDGRPVVLSERDLPIDVASFECLRISGQERTMGPAWERLPPEADVWHPTDQEKGAFDDLLRSPSPPGPTPLELIGELHHRGYEAFLVGGTVRDVIAGRRPRGLHIATTFPLSRAQHLLRAMYGPENIPDPLPLQARISGQIKVSANRERAVEFANLKLDQSGTETAKFGDSLEIDARHRDFCCNAVYYDPINSSLLDPTGRGVRDAENSTLHIARVKPYSPAEQAKVFIRSFSFLARGFTLDDDGDTIDQLISMAASLSSLSDVARFAYAEAQVMAHPMGTPDEKFGRFRSAMIEVGLAEIFVAFFEAGADIICGGRGNA